VLELFAVISIIYLAMTSGWDMVQRRLEAHFGKAYAERSPELLQRDDR
jgi:polar amino acid transport system permease protein